MNYGTNMSQGRKGIGEKTENSGWSFGRRKGVRGPSHRSADPRLLASKVRYSMPEGPLGLYLGDRVGALKLIVIV